MVRIAISQAAFDAIAKTLSLGTVAFEGQPDAKGQRRIWLESRALDRLAALCGPGEGYSEVILRLAAEERSGAH
jgi:hypothetical protein